VVSRASTALTRVVFPTSLTRISDPMSGFFAVRASSVKTDELRPLGYKILLELVVRSRPGRIVEVPYTFRARHAGQSKATAGRVAIPESPGVPAVQPNARAC
jgi:dolichol-phosphate mannosyltransferase